MIAWLMLYITSYTKQISPSTVWRRHYLGRLFMNFGTLLRQILNNLVQLLLLPLHTGVSMHLGFLCTQKHKASRVLSGGQPYPQRSVKAGSITASP